MGPKSQHSPLLSPQFAYSHSKLSFPSPQTQQHFLPSIGFLLARPVFPSTQASFAFPPLFWNVSPTFLKIFHPTLPGRNSILLFPSHSLSGGFVFSLSSEVPSCVFSLFLREGETKWGKKPMAEGLGEKISTSIPLCQRNNPFLLTILWRKAKQTTWPIYLKCR